MNQELGGCHVDTLYSYESINRDWEEAKKVHNDPFIYYEKSRNFLIKKFNAKAPESEKEIFKLGRHWNLKSGILPNTQAAVHQDYCTYCHGVQTDAFPGGAIHRYYPSDNNYYGQLLEVTKQLRKVAELNEIKNQIDPLTGTTTEDNGILKDSNNRALI